MLLRLRLQVRRPADLFRLSDRVPGVNRRTVENVVAEIGTDMASTRTRPN